MTNDSYDAGYDDYVAGLPMRNRDDNEYVRGYRTAQYFHEQRPLSSDHPGELKHV